MGEIGVLVTLALIDRGFNKALAYKVCNFTGFLYHWGIAYLFGCGVYGHVLQLSRASK